MRIENPRPACQHFGSSSILSFSIRTLLRAETMQRRALKRKASVAHNSNFEPGTLNDRSDTNLLSAKNMVANLSDAQMEVFRLGLLELAAGSRRNTIAIGSICTGTGMAEHSMLNLIKVSNRMHSDQPVEMSVAFGCDIAKDRVEFLKLSGHYPLIFKDAACMGNEANADWISDDLRQVPDSDVLVTGFSCKDLSAFVANRDEWATYINDVLAVMLGDPYGILPEAPQGSTLPTLLGVIRYCLVHRPRKVILENVDKIMAIMEILTSAHGKVSTVSFRVQPTSRHRVYMIGDRVHQKARDGCSTILQTQMEKVYKFLVTELAKQEMLNISAFLLPDDSPYFESSFGEEGNKHPAADLDYHANHNKMYTMSGLKRPTQEDLKGFADEFPIASMRTMFLQRPLREQEAAYYFSKTVETDTEAFVDVSQCITRITPSFNTTMTLTEGSKPFLLKRLRLMTGREALAVQGLSAIDYIAESPDHVLAKLAGNAFSASAVMFAIIAVVSARYD